MVEKREKEKIMVEEKEGGRERERDREYFFSMILHPLYGSVVFVTTVFIVTSYVTLHFH